MQIKCPQCDFTRDVPEEKIPQSSEMATCPRCGVKFRFRAIQAEDFSFDDQPTDVAPQADERPHSARQDSGFYGPDGRLHSRPSPGPVPAQDEQGESTLPPPFEDLENYGFFPGLGQTIRRALLQPRLFFRVMPLAGMARPLVFGLLLFEFYMILSLFWDMVGLPPVPGMGLGSGAEATMLESSGPATGLDPVTLFVTLPILFIINLFLNTGMLHGVLMLLKAAPRGFEATFRAVAYSYAPLVLCFLPYGYLVGWLWSLGLTVVGCAAIHRVPVWRAALGLGLMVVVIATLFFSAMQVPMPDMAGGPQQ